MWYIAASLLFIVWLAWLVSRGPPHDRQKPRGNFDRQAAQNREPRPDDSNAANTPEPKRKKDSQPTLPEPKDHLGPQSPTVDSVQVAFTGSAGMTIDRRKPLNVESQPLVAPVSMDFLPAAGHDLVLGNIPGHEGVELAATVEIRSISARVRACVAQCAVPLNFDDDDYEQALSGTLVVKVVYLPANGDDQTPQTVANTGAIEAADPLAVAEKHGEVIAVLRVGNRDARMPPMQEMFARAKARLQARDFVAAVRGFNDVVRAEPNAAFGYEYRALAYQCQGKLTLAIHDLNSAIRLEPQCARLYASRSNLHESDGQCSQAVADMVRAIELALAGQERTDVAKVSLMRDRLRDLLELLYAHTSALIRQGQHNKAIAELTQILRLRPDTHNAYLRRAVAYHKLGHLDAALADYDQALKLSPGPSQAFQWRSQIHEKKRNYASALADMRMAQWLSPGVDFGGRVQLLERRQAFQNSPQLAGSRGR